MSKKDKTSLDRAAEVSESASRIKDRVDNAKTVDAVPPSEPTAPQPQEPDPNKPKNPKIEGPVEVQDPMLNDNRKKAEDDVVREHGESIRTKGNFEELVQKELLKL